MTQWASPWEWQYATASAILAFKWSVARAKRGKTKRTSSAAVATCKKQISHIEPAKHKHNKRKKKLSKWVCQKIGYPMLTVKNLSLSIGLGIEVGDTWGIPDFWTNPNWIRQLIEDLVSHIPIESHLAAPAAAHRFAHSGGKVSQSIWECFSWQESSQLAKI